MNFINSVIKGLSSLIAAKAFADVAPFLEDEAKNLVDSGTVAVKIFLDGELSKEEKSFLFKQWTGQFDVFVESLKREGAYLVADLFKIVTQSAFEELASSLGFGND